MCSLDIPYLCTAIGNLFPVPIRVFKEDTLSFYYFRSHLPQDPMVLYQKEILAIHASVGYIVTQHFRYYGIVNSNKIKIVIGPISQISESDQGLRELAFQADVVGQDVDSFVTGMKSIVPMPFEALLQILCTINHVLNGEKISVADIVLYDADQKKLAEQHDRQLAENKLSSFSNGDPISFRTSDREQAITNIVQRGDTAALKKWIASAPPAWGGVLAKEQIRQRKNTFIVSTTIVSRAAIKGGMDVNDAFTYSDSYIQQCELLSAPEAIINLQYRMILDYTQRVERLRLGKQPTKLALDISNYIQHHMSETVTVEKIAKELYLSRPYLSRRFKAETGESLTDYILREKIEEAKRLLCYSEKPLTTISSYLGFSSPSHFSRVFRKYVLSTPREYRHKYAG